VLRPPSWKNGGQNRNSFYNSLTAGPIKKTYIYIIVQRKIVYKKCSYRFLSITNSCDVNSNFTTSVNPDSPSLLLVPQGPNDWEVDSGRKKCVEPEYERLASRRLDTWRPGAIFGAKWHQSSKNAFIGLIFYRSKWLEGRLWMKKMRRIRI
jgi:hypothetical protein